MKNDKININILDKEYVFSCRQDERQGLLEAASFLNQKMMGIKKNSKIVGYERISIMAALNIAYEYLKLKDAQQTNIDQDISQQIGGLIEKIDQNLLN